MDSYLIIMLAAVAVGFAIAASMSVRAYKEYTGNDLIKKENNEKFLKGKFFVLLSYISSKVFYAVTVAFILMMNSIDCEKLKFAFLVFGAAAIVCMLLQSDFIRKDTLAGALDNEALYSKTVLKIGLSEVIVIIPLIFLFISLQ